MARARLYGDEADDLATWTDYVASRWYRAPELIAGRKAPYTTKVPAATPPFASAARPPRRPERTISACACWSAGPGVCVLLSPAPAVLTSTALPSPCPRPTQIDNWAIGCIMGELMSRKTMFPGRNGNGQLDLITNVCGGPSHGLGIDMAFRLCVSLPFSAKPCRFLVMLQLPQGREARRRRQVLHGRAVGQAGDSRQVD